MKCRIRTYFFDTKLYRDLLDAECDLGAGNVHQHARNGEARQLRRTTTRHRRRGCDVSHVIKTFLNFGLEINKQLDDNVYQVTLKLFLVNIKEAEAREVAPSRATRNVMTSDFRLSRANLFRGRRFALEPEVCTANRTKSSTPLKTFLPGTSVSYSDSRYHSSSSIQD